MSCAEEESKVAGPIKYETPIELKIFEEHFYSIYGGKRFTGSIYFANNINPYIGMCSYYYNYDGVYNTIRINPDYWYNISQYQKEQLMFHELAHCIYKLQHDTTIVTLRTYNNKMKCPKSIMYPILFDTCYNNYRTYYLEELRNKIKGT